MLHPERVGDTTAEGGWAAVAVWEAVVAATKGTAKVREDSAEVGLEEVVVVEMGMAKAQQERAEAAQEEAAVVSQALETERLAGVVVAAVMATKRARQVVPLQTSACKTDMA